MTLMAIEALIGLVCSGAVFQNMGESGMLCKPFSTGWSGRTLLADMSSNVGVGWFTSNAYLLTTTGFIIRHFLRELALTPAGLLNRESAK